METKARQSLCMHKSKYAMIIKRRSTFSLGLLLCLMLEQYCHAISTPVSCYCSVRVCQVCVKSGQCVVSTMWSISCCIDREAVCAFGPNFASKPLKSSQSWHKDQPCRKSRSSIIKKPSAFSTKMTTDSSQQKSCERS